MYDEHGNFVNANGRVLRYKRDANGNLIQKPAFQEPDPGPTDEEIAGVYRSLGVPLPEEGTA